MSIEGILLEYFTALTKADINTTTPSYQGHALFHFFKSDDKKQDADTTTAHSKSLITFLKRKKLSRASLGTILDNTDGLDKKHRCASAQYVISVMFQSFSVIIDRRISVPGHGKEVLDGLNAVDKHYIYQLMSTVQLIGTNIFDSRMQMHTRN